MRLVHAWLATTCLAAGLLTGCGSAQSGLSASRADALRSELAAVESHAAGGDRAGALTALSAVSATVSRDASQLTSSERTALRTGIAHLRSRILATVAAPATTAITTSAPAAVSTPTAPPGAPAPPAAPGPHGGGPQGHGPPGHDHGHHHGHGDGGGD